MGKNIAVVGSGPAGMCSAVQLASLGHEVTVYEALDDLSENSRASTFHPPTLELLETLGLLDELLDRGLRVDTFQYRSRVNGLVAELDLSVLSGDTPHPYRLQLEQSALTRMLQRRFIELGGTMRFGHRLNTVDAEPDGVTLRFDAQPGARASWVIGADGASSAVRRSLGVTFEGMTYEDRFLVVTVDVDLEAMLPGIAPVNYVSDRDEWLVLLQLPVGWRVLFPIGPDEDPDASDAESRIRARLAGVTDAAGRANIVDWSMYAVHQRVADRFRDGRVLLVGDAAHVNSPIGGMGMNSGLHDTFAFCPVLDRVIRGAEPEDALDDVAETRRRIASDFVRIATDRNTRELSLADEAADEARRADLRALANDRERLRDHLLTTSMLTVTDELRTAVRGV